MEWLVTKIEASVVEVVNNKLHYKKIKPSKKENFLCGMK